MTDKTCTCPEEIPGSTVQYRDKECPEHGLEATIGKLGLPLKGLTMYRYPDGYKVLATSQETADSMHKQHVARQN